MDKQILPGTNDPNNPQSSSEPLLYQDINLLMELVVLSHEWYKEDSVLYEESFMSYLRGFIEPIEAICRKNKKMSDDYYIACIEFHRHIHHDFWKEVPTLEPFFNALAYLIQQGIESFRLLNYPQPYLTVVEQLAQILDNEVIIREGKQEVANLLIEQLRQKPL